MKLKSIVALCALVSLSCLSAFAAESGSVIANQAEMKAKVLNHLQAQIARHQGMTQEQIIQEVTETGATNRARLEKMASLQALAGYDMELAAEIDVMKQLDKDGIVALEEARLQTIMTSSNWIFALSRSNREWLRECDPLSLCGSITIILTPFAIFGDIVLLPFELLATLISR